jgi:hypothetical protein
MRDALAPVRDEYDLILIDCPPSLGLITLNMLAAADGILIPLQCEYYALEGLSQLLNTVQMIQRGVNTELAIDGVLLTMFDARLNLSRQVVNDAREYFGDRVFKTTIPRNVRLAEAPSFGKPIILYDIASVGAQAYMAVARELLARQARAGKGGEPAAEDGAVNAADAAAQPIATPAETEPSTEVPTPPESSLDLVDETPASDEQAQPQGQAAAEAAEAEEPADAADPVAGTDSADSGELDEGDESAEADESAKRVGSASADGSVQHASDPHDAPDDPVEDAEGAEDPESARVHATAESGDSSAPAFVNPEPTNDEQ